MIIRRLLEIEGKPLRRKKMSNHSALNPLEYEGGKFKSLNYVTRKNDYNRIKNENMRIISKIQNVKSDINSMNLRNHIQKQNKLKKLITKNSSISQMIENSRYKIAYSSFCPTPGFLSTKNTPRFKKIADQMLQEENKNIYTKIKNWNVSVFKSKNKPSITKHNKSEHKSGKLINKGEEINIHVQEENNARENQNWMSNPEVGIQRPAVTLSQESNLDEKIAEEVWYWCITS